MCSVHIYRSWTKTFVTENCESEAVHEKLISPRTTRHCTLENPGTSVELIAGEAPTRVSWLAAICCTRRSWLSALSAAPARLMRLVASGVDATVCVWCGGRWAETPRHRVRLVSGGRCDSFEIESNVSPTLHPAASSLYSQWLIN